MQELTALALPRALLLVEDSGAIDPDVARELEASLRPLSHQPDVRDVVVALLDRASLFSLAASWDNDREDLPLSRFAARIERWMALGVPELAVQLVRSLGPVANKLGDIPERAVQAAEHDKAVRSALFEQNLSALALQSPQAAELLRNGPRGVLAMRPHGVGLVLCDSAGEPTSLVAAPTLQDSLARASQLIESQVSHFEDIMVAGVSDGAVLSILLPMREMQAAESGEDFAVWLVEPSLAKVRAMLEVLDVSRALARGALVVHTGDDFEGSLRRMLGQPGAVLPTKVIGHHEVVEAAVRRVGPEIENLQEQRFMKAHESQSARAGEVRKRWRAAGQGGGSLRFLLIANTHDGGRLTGIGETLERLGHEVLTFVQPSNVAFVSRAEVAEAAASFEADAVFTLDRVRTEISAAPDPIPFVTWDMGPLAHVREALRKNLVGTHDHLLLAAPEVAHSIGWPAARSHSFPTFANPAVVEAARALGGPLPPVADVGFIGNFTGTAEQNVDLLRREHQSDGAHVARAINRAYERLRAHTGDLPPPPRQLLETFRDGLGATSDADPSRLYEQFLSQVAAPFYRLRTLEHLEQQGVALALFGAGWEKHPTLSRFAKERLAGPAELARAYLSTRVQLRLPFGRSLHPKLVDGAAIGACMVIRRSPSDFIGRIRRATQPLAAPSRPAKMTGEEWTYFLEELAMWGDPSLHGATLGVQRAGLDRAGVATDDIFAPELFDRISAANDQELLETIVRLVENPDERLQVAEALRSSVEANLDPAVLLARIITEIASQEASRPSSMRPPPGFNVPIPSLDNKLDNKKMLAKSLRLL